MFKLNVSVAAFLGFVAVASPSVAQNAPWPPPAGMSAGEYLQRYGRQYNPATGFDPRREDRNRYYQSLPEAPKPYTPPAAAVRSSPSAGLRPEYNPETGGYELPCSPAARADPYASLKPTFNAHTGAYEVPCAKRR
jgi:hypothetical protein